MFSDRRHIRDGQHELCELTFEEHRILNGVQMVCHFAFHNIGPSTANDWSNRVWLAAELERLLGGMTAKFPTLGRDTNWMLTSLLVLPCRQTE